MSIKTTTKHMHRQSVSKKSFDVIYCNLTDLDILNNNKIRCIEIYLTEAPPSLWCPLSSDPPPLFCVPPRPTPGGLEQMFNL